MTVRSNSLASRRVQCAVRAALCALAVGSAVEPVLAADDESLGEVVVTAQRREENLQNVPVAITAVVAVYYVFVRESPQPPAPPMPSEAEATELGISRPASRVATIAAAWASAAAGSGGS